MLSCSKDEEPYLSINQTDVSINNSGGSQTISFESNMNWTARSSENWCTVSPSSGDASVKSTNVTVSGNETYDDRNCNVTITVGSLSKTVTISQNSKLGLYVTKDKYELSNEATTIEVEVKTNIEYDISISDNWITDVTTRGLSTTNLKFNIDKNDTYDSREASITIKQKNGSLASTIKVLQSQLDAVIISKKIVDLLSNSQTLEVEFDTNMDFEVIIPDVAKNWITYTPTRGLRTENILLNIAENNGVDTRSAEVYIKNKESILQDTLTIYQYEKSVYYVRNMGTLNEILNETMKDTITTMIVRGEINKADFDVMKLQIPKLRNIDLSDVKCEGDIIPYQAFGGNNANKYITSIVLPTSIKTIGSRAFLDCIGLTGSLVIPDKVINIKDRAFARCTGFTGSLVIPNKVKIIEDLAFLSCTGFNGYLTLSSDLEYIGRKAFDSCANLIGSLTIPDKVTSIDDYAFTQCLGFNGSLSLPDELTSIGKSAFSDCPSITGTLTLPDKLTIIEEYTFSGLKEITELILGNNITTIHDGAFSNCDNILGDVLFPVSVESIRKNAFYNCTRVDAFRFPHSTLFSYYPDMLPNGATVKVPNESVVLYKSTDGWKNYNIVGY